MSEWDTSSTDFGGGEFFSKPSVRAVMAMGFIGIAAVSCKYAMRPYAEVYPASASATVPEATTTIFDPQPATEAVATFSLDDVPIPPPEFYAQIELQETPPETMPPTTPPTTTAPTTIETTTTTIPPNGCGGPNTIRLNLNPADRDLAIQSEIGVDFVDKQHRKLNRDGTVMADPFSGYTYHFMLNEGITSEGSPKGVKSECIRDIPPNTVWVYFEGYPQAQNESNNYIYGTARIKERPGNTSQATMRFPLICQEGSSDGETGTITARVEGQTVYRIAVWGKNGYGVFDGNMTGYDTNTLSGLLGGEYYIVQIQTREDENVIKLDGTKIYERKRNYVPVEKCAETIIHISQRGDEAVVVIDPPGEDFKALIDDDPRLVG